MKNLFLKLGLLPALILAAAAFVSCGGNKPVLPDNSVIRAGNVISLTGSTSDIDSVRAMAYDWMTTTRTSIAEAPFQNNGFTMQLPTTLPDNFLRAVESSFPRIAEVTITGNSNARWLPNIDLAAFNKSGNEIGTVNLVGGIDFENITGTVARWVYVDSNVSVTVPNTAILLGQPTINFIAANLSLRKGWNIVYATISIENFGNIRHITTTLTTQRPPNVIFAWTFISLEDEFPFNLLDANGFFR